MSWGTKRRNTFIFLVVLVFLIPIIVISFLTFYKPPNCFDGKQNGDEVGVDCGGKCVLLCNNQTLPPTVLWERYFKVSDGNYNAVAYIENQNPDAGIRRANYIFKFFNMEGVMIASKEGSMRIFPKSVFPVIENGFDTGKQLPTRVSFEFKGGLVFEKETPQSPVLVVEDEEFIIDNFPKVKAKLQNISLDSVSKIKVIVLLYDVFDNVIGSSSTVVDRIEGESSKDIVFTWPNDFKEEVSRIEVIPIYE